MSNPNASELIDGFIAEQPAWQQKILQRLRHIIHKADPQITEDWKWSSPIFSHHGNLFMIFQAKEWVNFTFIQGALIKDRHKLFNFGTENKRSRTVKFSSVDDLTDTVEKALLEYVKESVANSVLGKKVALPKPARKEPADVPAAIMRRLREAGMADEYRDRPPYQQRGYLQWIDEAKLEETKEKRIQRMLDELKEGSYMPPKEKK